MNKKITIELTQQEYDALAKLWEQAKSSTIMPSKALNIDDFCKEIVVSFSKGPDFSNLNMEDLMSSLGDLGGLENLKDAFEAFSGKKKEQPKQEPKKEEVPDDQKYKS